MSAEARARLWASRAIAERRPTVEGAARDRAVRLSLRRLRARAISTAHAVVLGFGILTALAGIYLVLAQEFAPASGTVLLLVGIVLIILGLGETLFEGERGRR